MKEPNSKDCIPICASMAFGCTVEEFKAAIKPSEDGSYTPNNFIEFGFSKKYMIGIVPDNPVVEPEKRVSFNIKNLPALVVVESKYNSETKHAVYWDGNMIWDPHPHVSDGLPFGSYKVLGFYPIIKLTGDNDANS